MTTAGGVKRKAPEDGDGDNPGSRPIEITPKILHQRLLVGLGNKGGAKGSLTKCVARVGAVLRDPDNSTLKEAAVREFEHQQLELMKLYWMVYRNQIELETLNSSINITKQQASEESVIVQEKRKELRKQLTVTACEREYEALAKVATTRHPTSRRALQQQLDRVLEQYKETEEAVKRTKKEVAIRQSQFQLLMQSLFDLKQSLQEPLDVAADNDPETARNHEEEDENGEEEEEKEGTIVAMDVEPAALTGPAEDLYDDL
ncbi:hypothetical protein FisN_21Lh048 [Fistulifera solaris]|uniref:THO complex subunit 7 n=1 Tax=Fistulifera solaris TaxID=1519565 RepID=A0A1Z5KJV5_FISSO|nr:hypothetical protein FisN_21Lh048 [Fistulifera solaris]|eukprot:GAX26583.1 hypothetical protein FisN_21Lh048 [Fistulifera solaris]